MSGGRLVVLDRLGRDAKAYALAEGSASIGSDPACDIRVILPGVRPHHATVAVHASRTLLRAVAGETLLNGAPVSVAALRHGDTLQLGGRVLRWDYGRPPPASAAAAAATPTPPCLAVPRRGAAARARRRSEPARRALHAPGRDSAPASTSTSGKQVAIVQPQRRDTSERKSEFPSGPFADPLAPPTTGASATPPASTRKSLPSKSPKPLPADDPTKASLWIESRKPRASLQLLVQSPRNSPRNSSNLTTAESPRISRKRSSNVSSEPLKKNSAILRASHISRERVDVSPGPVSPRNLSPDPVSPRAVSPGPRSPRVSLRGAAKSAPLRLAVLKKAHSAQYRVTKIRAPLKIDHTKQAAILLMTGHAARSSSVGPPARPRSAGPPARPRSAGSPAQPRSAGPPSRPRSAGPPARPRSAGPPAQPRSAGPPSRPRSAGPPARPRSAGPSARLPPPRRTPARASAPPRAPGRPPTRASLAASPLQIKPDVAKPGNRPSQLTAQSPALASPKKSALKDPTAKKSIRKTESIKFDLSNLSTSSNLESYNSIASEVFLADNAEDLQDTMSDEDITLHYSDNSISKSPSPMKSIHSRSSLMIEKSLGSPMQTPTFEKSSFNVQSPGSKKSLRGSIIVQKALNNSDSRYSRRTTKSLSDHSYSTTITSRNSQTPSQRSTHLRAYSIVDLVSVNSNESGRSVYNSVDSSSTASFGTPGTVRKTRSKSSSLLGSSTPYSKKTLSPKMYNSEAINQNESQRSRLSTRRSASFTIQGNIPNISFNSTKMSRPSRNTLCINDSDLIFVDVDENEELPPRSSRKSSKNLLSPVVTKNISTAVPPSDGPTNGTITPENLCSPLDIGTPMLSIQNLLDQSSVSQISQPAQNSRNTRSNLTRRTISSTFFEPKRSRLSIKSRSLNLTGTRSLRSRRMRSDSLNGKNQSNDADDALTPKSAVKLVQEAVKNKHSTAKKPQSKRSLIDNLDDSDFVKELFNSPVKRKLSQSMTEFSRKFFDDDVVKPSRPTRNTVALTGRTPDNSLLNNTQELPPEIFVSPLSTPSNSPNLPGLKRILRKNTPENDLRNISGVKTLLRTPRARKSINNDLSNISGVKKLFGKSPRNRLSDVRVKDVFALSPTADYRRVSGVKALFQRSPLNDLRNISGVKRALRVNTPTNNLSDVRGVKRLFREQYNENNSSDVSGVEELRESPGRGGHSRGIGDGSEHRILESDPSKSTSGSTGTRELRKRRTNDSVTRTDGHTPPPASRSDDGRKRSASELYSARKLPLKKRSLASPRRSRDAALPLKKRALPSAPLSAAPHSTPLRPAARGLSMNASELARVSPIAAVAHGTSPPPSEVPGPRAARARRPRAAKDEAEVIAVAKPSPKRTRGGVKRGSPARAARGRKTNDIETASSDVNSLKKIISAGQKSNNKVTPKKTRAKILKDTVVVRKPSPQIKLRSKRQIKEKRESLQMEKAKRTRNANNDNIKGAKTRKTKEIAEVQHTEKIEPLKPKRGRKIAVAIEATSAEDVPVKKRGRKAREVPNVSETQERHTRKIPLEPEPNKTSRGKKVNRVSQRKVAILKTSPVKLVKTKIVDEVIRKSRRGAKDIEDKKNTSTKKTIEKPDKKTRASKKNVAGSAEVELKTDGRKTKKTIAKEETKPAKAKKAPPARALRKRPATDLDTGEDTAVETKKRRTRRAAV